MCCFLPEVCVPSEAERSDGPVSTSSSNESLCSRSSRDHNPTSGSSSHHHNHHLQKPHHSNSSSSYNPSKQQQHHHSSSSNSSSPPLSSKRLDTSGSSGGSQASSLMSSSLPSCVLASQLAGITAGVPLQQQLMQRSLTNGCAGVTPLSSSYQVQQLSRDLRSLQHSSIASSTPSQYQNSSTSSGNSTSMFHCTQFLAHCTVVCF